MARGRITPGQSLERAISARAWNRAQDAADVVLERNEGLGVDPSELNRVPNFVMIRNESGVAVPRFGVLAIEGVVIDPSGGTLTGTDQASSLAREFARRPVVRGITPILGYEERFAVLLEPAPADAVVRAAVGGTFACLVHIVNTGHRFATIKNGDRTQLQSASCGIIQLLWKEPTTGPNKWAVGVM